MPPMLFLTRLTQNCAQNPAKTALEFLHPHAPQTVAYSQLEAAVQQTMRWLLSLGVQPGDRVALQLPKCLPFIYLHLATMRLGAITLPLNPDYPPQELAYFLADSAASIFFAAAAAQPIVAPIAAGLPALTHTIYLHPHDPAHFSAQLAAAPSLDLPPLPHDPHQTALMIYTSGTTGQPKGAEITHGNLTANLDALHEAWGWRADDLLLHVLPLFHVHGLVVALHGALHAAASAILLPRFVPTETLQILMQRRCTVFMGVPTIHRRLVECPAAAACDLSHMRLLTSGSDRLPDELFHRFQQTFGHTLLERYGMTETGMNLSNPLQGERRVGSVGLPLPGVEARIVHSETGDPLPDGEIGELQIRGPHVFKGYWQMPAKTAAAFTPDGWLRTGDLGLRQPDGYFTLKGRAKDLIITGGLNVYPPEVELVLAEHPDVAASAVIGCPDPEWGERIVAAIVPRPGAAVTAAAIREHCKQKLANYKVPRTIVFVDDLPRNALGKIQKNQLRQALCENQNDLSALTNVH
ncbi:MAG: acyl-CoA synthetase [Candidatus Promineifilaceae bacterium]